MTRDSITWFEIPARDIARAARFYETLLGKTLRRESMLGTQLAVFPAADDGMGFFAHIEDSEGNRVGLHAPA